MSDQIRVVFFHQSSDLYGSDKVLLSLVSNLDRNKFLPIVLLPSEGPLTKEIMKAGIECKVVTLVQVNRSTLSFSGLIRLPLRVYKSIKSINIALDGIKVDVVHSNTLAVLSGAVWAKINKIKHVWHVHEIIVHPVIVRKFFAILLRTLSTRVICNSNATLCNILNDQPALKKDSIVVWNGLDKLPVVRNNDSNNIRLQFGLSDSDVLVVLVGRVNRMKGQKLLVESATQLYKKHANTIHYLLVGDAPSGQEYYLHELKEAVGMSDARNTIHLLPFTEQIERIWRSCDIAVVPSTEPESFGMVALEAMAAKKPVIAADHGGITEIVVNNETGILINHCDEKALSDAIETLAENSILRNKMGEAGFSRLINTFSLTNYVSSMSAIYEQVNDFK